MLLDGAKNRYDDPPPSFNAAMGITSRANSMSAHPSSPPQTYNPNYRTYNPAHDPFINTAEEIGVYPTVNHPAVKQGNHSGTQWLSPVGTSSGGSFVHSEASSSNIVLSHDPRRTTHNLDSQQPLPMHVSSPSSSQPMQENDASQPVAPQRGGWSLIWLGLLLFCTSPLYVSGFILIAAGKIIEGCGLILTSIGNWTKAPHERLLQSFQMVEGGGSVAQTPNPQMTMVNGGVDERRNTAHMV